MHARTAGQRNRRPDGVLTSGRQRTAAVTVLLTLAVLLPGRAIGATAPPTTYGLTASPNPVLGIDLTRVTVTLTGANTGAQEASVTLKVRLNGTDNGDIVVTYYADRTATGSAPLRGRGNCGRNIVEVGEYVSGDVGNPSWSPWASAVVGSLCPSLALKPDRVYQSQLPAKFWPGYQGFDQSRGSTPVQILLDGAVQQLAPTGNAPYFTASPSCGPHQVQARQQTASGPATADATLTVVCPQITLAPASIPKSGEPTSSTVTGQGFPPNAPVQLAIDGTRGPAVTADPNGGLTAALPVAGLDCGVHQVTATAAGATPSTAVAQLTVTGCRAGALTVDPVVLEPGMLTHVTGQGFQPGQRLALTWQTPDGSPLIGETDATADPSGNLDAWCMAMQHDLIGARRLVAAASGAPTTVLATADVVVDSSGMVPTAGSHLVFRR